MLGTLIFFSFLSLFIHFEREKETAGVGEGQKESQAGSAPSAQSLMWGLNSQTMRPLPEPKPRVGRLTD